MRLAVIEFTQLQTATQLEPRTYTVDEVDAEMAKQTQTYVEARLIDPPIDFAIGYGRTLSDAFADLQSRVLDTAIYSARLLHDDPEEWKRQSERNSKTEIDIDIDSTTGVETQP